MSLTQPFSSLAASWSQGHRWWTDLPPCSASRCVARLSAMAASAEPASGVAPPTLQHRLLDSGLCPPARKLTGQVYSGCWTGLPISPPGSAVSLSASQEFGALGTALGSTQKTALPSGGDPLCSGHGPGSKGHLHTSTAALALSGLCCHVSLLTRYLKTPVPYS